MKKCIRCGKMIKEELEICDSCGFDFIKHEVETEIPEELEDLEVPKKLRSNLIDNPVFTFIFGILSILVALMFVFSRGIVVIFFVIGIALVIVTTVFAAKPSKKKMREVRNVGNWMSNIAFVLLVFKLVFEIIGNIMK